MQIVATAAQGLMGRGLHARAKITPTVRTKFQRSLASARAYKYLSMLYMYYRAIFFIIYYQSWW
jgi:hypothetical protein